MMDDGTPMQNGMVDEVFPMLIFVGVNCCTGHAFYTYEQPHFLSEEQDNKHITRENTQPERLGINPIVQMSPQPERCIDPSPPMPSIRHTI
jgi:hypothetical protein